MSVNINQFGIYSAKVFELLYDSFPIPRSIDKNEIIAEYLTFDQGDELKELKLKLDIAGIVELIEDEEENEKIRTKLPPIKKRIAELEESQQNDRSRQERIFVGTLQFLTSERLIRKCELGGYQLTAKGFSHLSMNFKNGEIADDGKSNISILKAIFDKSSDTSLQVAAGTAVNVITKILGYG